MRPAAVWITTHRGDPEFYPFDRTESLGGVDWNDARLPLRWHRCRPQSRAWLKGDYIERCACGGIRYNSSRWLRRNETRDHRCRDRRIARSAQVQVTCRRCGKDYETRALAADAGGLCTSCWGDDFVRGRA